MEAAKNKHPPGRAGSLSQPSQSESSLRRRGSPSDALNAGFSTASMKRSCAAFRTSSSSSSFERKCAKRPLLLTPSSFASLPRLKPARPSRDESLKARSTMRSRVASPFVTLIKNYDRSFFLSRRSTEVRPGLLDHQRAVRSDELELQIQGHLLNTRLVKRSEVGLNQRRGRSQRGGFLVAQDRHVRRLGREALANGLPAPFAHRHETED